LIRQISIRTISILLLPSLMFIFAQDISRYDYKIGPQDLLDISVFGVDELNRTVRVSENGRITLPHLGEIDVEGLNKTELETKLKQLLGETLLQDPQVTVFIQEYQSKKVSVLGAVQNPGTYELLGRQTLLQIISKAGGLTDLAGDNIFVIRELEGGKSTSLTISIDELFFKANAELNIALQPNDVINVPVDKIVKIYVMGQVTSPGALEVKRSQIPTLLQAIAHAGGFAQRASKGSVLIKRTKEDGKEEQIKVNVKDIIKGKRKDIQLKENDTVVVPETIF